MGDRKIPFPSFFKYSCPKCGKEVVQSHRSCLVRSGKQEVCPNCNLEMTEEAFVKRTIWERRAFEWFWVAMIFVGYKLGGLDQVNKPPYIPFATGTFFLISCFTVISYFLGEALGFVKVEEYIPMEEVSSTPNFSVRRFLREFMHLPLVVGISLLAFLSIYLFKKYY